ncbi:hypothetical protein BYT27DRAFT_6847908 [Phlegmacium glaucopus]|nr:hypothetical protein BYT27DRAFT_6847908 [Phlegmacium glaucopus]
MLRQCIHPNQKDWVAKLPAIEFAINSARSESTGYAPFFLNFGRMPRSMIWNSPPSSEFPAIREFALQKKLALMSAHDSILAARVKQTRDANRKRISRFRKVSHLDLPPHLKRRGVHDVFHSSLLCIHVPNDDRLFPGRMDTQISNSPETEEEWAVERILSHAGSKTNSVFEIKWKSGDTTWSTQYQFTTPRSWPATPGGPSDIHRVYRLTKFATSPSSHSVPPVYKIPRSFRTPTIQAYSLPLFTSVLFYQPNCRLHSFHYAFSYHQSNPITKYRPPKLRLHLGHPLPC